MMVMMMMVVVVMMMVMTGKPAEGHGFSLGTGGRGEESQGGNEGE